MAAGQEMELDVGIVARPAAERTKAARLEMVGGAEPGLEEQPLRADQRLAKTSSSCELSVIGCDAFLLDIDFQMILQILADARPVCTPRQCRAAARSAAGPMPDSSSSFGELIDEAARITSRRALTT